MPFERANTPVQRRRGTAPPVVVLVLLVITSDRDIDVPGAFHGIE